MDEQIKGSLSELHDCRPGQHNALYCRITTHFRVPKKVVTTEWPLIMTMEGGLLSPHIINHEMVKGWSRQRPVSQKIMCDIYLLFPSWIFSELGGIMTTTDPCDHTRGKNTMIIVRCYAVDERDLSERLHLVYAPWIDITYNGDNDNSIIIREATDE
jgi:hypothetical protein